MSDEPSKKTASMPAGGAVLAVVPQSVEEIQRISNMVISAGIAPASLVYRKKQSDTDDDVRMHNIAAVATAIMAGAELGLPPLVALRSFTVINGRPALYADGNVAVVRKAKDREGRPICQSLKNGYDLTDSDETTGAWCEATRSDNGETHREFFSVSDAKRAGLWDENVEVDGEVWEYSPAERKRVPRKAKVPNPSPWHRFPKRMLLWRATGYCLRWLFADVLGGMPDEYEAREIEAMIDITPPAMTARPKPPAPPEPDEEREIDGALVAQEDGVVAEKLDVVAAAAEDVVHSPMSPPVPPNFDDIDGETADTSDEARFLSQLDRELAAATSLNELAEVFEGSGAEDADIDALTVYDKHRERIERAELEAAGQASMFPGAPPAKRDRKSTKE